MRADDAVGHAAAPPALEALLDHSRDCIKTLDLDGRLLSMNAGGQAALEICDIGALLGQSWVDFWQGEDRAAAVRAVEEARGGGIGHFVGYFPLTQSRRPAWWDVVVSRLPESRGAPPMLLAVSREVTELKLAHEALAREIETRERINAVFRAVSEGATRVGDEFFPAFTEQLARALGVRYAFIAECIDPERTRVRMKSFWKADRLASPVEYDVAGTPCERVVAGEWCHIPDHVARSFPGDPALATWGARGYIGIPLRDGSQHVIGHLVLIDDRPIEATDWMESALHAVAARAAAELERAQADRFRREAMAELERAKLRAEAENVYLRDEVARQGGFDDIIGRSPAILRTLDMVRQVAPTDTTVLIVGETGTGKELVARALHATSPRKDRTLVSINCGAISPNLVESELFGHEKGAFTGATGRRAGRFELADGGSLFLDEIGDLSLDLQVKLLRVLQEGEFTRVGGTHVIRVDVRVIAATHRDLAALVRQGAFREDLYYRLNVFPIRTPPLRDRLEDLPHLVEYFVRRYATRMGRRIDAIPRSVLELLARHQWPGNVRELANVVERSVIITRGSTLELAEWMTGQYQPVTAGGTRPDGSTSLASLEREHILEALRQAGWKVSGPGGAAQALGLKPTTLEARMKKLGIERPNRGGAARP